MDTWLKEIKMFKKLIVFAGMIVLSVIPSYATVWKSVLASTTNAAQGGMSGYALNLGSGTISNFNSSTATINTQINGGLINGNANGISIQGSNTNDSGAAGKYGQWFSSHTVNVTTPSASGTFRNVVSTTLAAGDYDVTGIIVGDMNGGTVTVFQACISLFSNADTTDHVTADNLATESRSFGTSDITTLTVPTWRLSLANSTTVYLKQRFTYSGGAPQSDGARLSWRRAR